VGLACATIVFAPAARADDADAVARCIGANERSVDLRKAGRLVEARRELAGCAASSCPEIIQQACTRRMAQVNEAMPSLVFEVTDAAGAVLSNVSVSLDGGLLIPLPRTAVAVDPGSHALRFESAGRPPVEQTVVVLEGERQKRVTAVMGGGVAREPPSQRRLVVRADPPATLRVDGEIVEGGRFDAPLPAGPHDIFATGPGKVPFKTQVDLRAGETHTMTVGLLDAVEKRKTGPGAWPWIVGGAAVAAGAAVGAYFLLRPQDSTLGVPPGKTATVQLMLRTGGN
jgi:hypothetical protein